MLELTLAEMRVLVLVLQAVPLSPNQVKLLKRAHRKLDAEIERFEYDAEVRRESDEYNKKQAKVREKVREEVGVLGRKVIANLNPGLLQAHLAEFVAVDTASKEVLFATDVRAAHRAAKTAWGDSLIYVARVGEHAVPRSTGHEHL